MERKKKTNNNECPFCNPKPVGPFDNIAGNDEKWKEHQYHQQNPINWDEEVNHYKERIKNLSKQ